MFPPTVRRLGWLHFWNDFTLDFLTPLLPTGVKVEWVGVMEGFADGLGQVLKLVTGRASDRDGRRVPWVRAGYAANAVFRPLAAVGMLCAWPFWIVGCRVLDRVGKGLRGSASDALVADWVPGEGRAIAYARMRVMDHLGATLGALAAAAAAWLWPQQLGWVVAGLVLPALIVLWLCRGLADSPEARPKPGASAPGWWPREPRLAFPLALIGFASLGAKLAPLLVLVQVAGFPSDAGQGRWEPWAICLFWAALGLVQSLAAGAAGLLTGRLGACRFLALGWGIGALLFAGLALAQGWGLAAIGLAWGALAGFTEGAEKTWIADLAPKEERATAFGGLALLLAAGGLLGSGATGFALAAWGPAVFWAPAAVLVLASLIASMTPRPRDPATPRQDT